METHPFQPTPIESVARARADLGIGLPILLHLDGAMVLAAAAERVSPERLEALTRSGEAVLVLTRWRAETLKIRIYDGDLARLPLGRDTEPGSLLEMIDPSRDLAAPMKGPFAPVRGGDAALHRAALTLAKAARLLPAVIVCPVTDPPPGVTPLDASALDGGEGVTLARVVSARLPIAAALDTRLHVFRPEDGSEEHYAVEIGRPDPGEPVLARLHSACFTGDVLGSLKCDCGAQLDAALHRMAAAGGGLLLYLNQEGRGIGLANKMRAYSLQDQGFDTVEANHRLGFDDDERDFRLGAALLRGLNVRRVRLMTNNPRKVRMLGEAGIAVTERVPLWVGRTAQNHDYLRAKAEKSGHLE